MRGRVPFPPPADLGCKHGNFYDGPLEASLLCYLIPSHQVFLRTYVSWTHHTLLRFLSFCLPPPPAQPGKRQVRTSHWAARVLSVTLQMCVALCNLQSMYPYPADPHNDLWEKPGRYYYFFRMN